MAAEGLPVRSGQDFVNSARRLIQLTWVRNPDCTIHDPEASKCLCRQKFFDIHALEDWMSATEDGHSLCNVKRLVAAIDFVRPNFFGQTSVLEGETRSVLVLSYLLLNNHEKLLYMFCSAGITDNILDAVNPRLQYQNLRRIGRECEARSGYSLSDIKSIIEHFEEEKWAFCPAQIHGNKQLEIVIKKRLPFFALSKINDKGGTASVTKVCVQEAFLSTEIRGRLGAPLARHPKYHMYGRYYELAIKSYPQSRRVDYMKETNAFAGLQDLSGVLRCFGSYSHRDGLYLNEETFNLILELATVDLYEWISDIDSPQLTEEILETYRAVKIVAETIRQIHQCKHHSDSYYGWHGDIKPDNILWVEGQWKLADFGFSEFELARRTIFDGGPGDLLYPTIPIRGGTTTYGAPDSAKKKSQTIDIWSFGCVLSVLATWIVKGLRGVREFENHRAIACRKHKSPTNSDAFHDGNNVYPDIKDWHDHLNEVLRKSDTVTSKILALVDNHMLRSKPEDRISSAQLCNKLDEILEEAENSLKAATKPARNNHVRESLLMTELQLVPNIAKPAETARIFKLPVPSQDGKYLQIYAQPSGGESSANAATLGMTGRKTLSVAHRESTLRKSVDIRTALVSHTAQTATIEFQLATPECGPHDEAPTTPSLGPPETGSSNRRHNSLLDTRSEDHTRAGLDRAAVNSAPSIRETTNSGAIAGGSSSLLTNDNRSGGSRLSTSTDQDTRRGVSIGSKYFSANVFWTAVRNGKESDLEIVRLALKEDPAMATLIRESGESCRTPIMEAADRFNLSIVKELVKYSDLGQADSGGQTVLHLLVLALIQRGRIETDYSNFAEVLKELLAKNPVDKDLINRVDHSGSSPLCLCVSSTDEAMVPIVKDLLAAGAWINPPRDARDKSIGNNVLKRAAMEGSLALVKLLIEKGGRVSREEIDVHKIPSSRVRQLLKDGWNMEKEEIVKKKSVIGGLFKKKK